MFTSEVRADFRKISESLFIKDSEEERALFAHESPEWSLPVEDLLKPFVPVLDALYPYFCRRNFLRKTRLYALIYLHRVLRWRKELVYLFPGSSNRLQMFKKKFRQHFRQLLSIVEYTYRHRDHDLLASWIFLIYDDVYYLADLDVVKQDAASHLRQLLEYILFISVDSSCHIARPMVQSIQVERRENETRTMRFSSCFTICQTPPKHLFSAQGV